MRFVSALLLALALFLTLGCETTEKSEVSAGAVGDQQCTATCGSGKTCDPAQCGAKCDPAQCGAKCDPANCDPTKCDPTKCDPAQCGGKACPTKGPQCGKSCPSQGK